MLLRIFILPFELCINLASLFLVNLAMELVEVSLIWSKVLQDQIKEVNRGACSEENNQPARFCGI